MTGNFNCICNISEKKKSKEHVIILTFVHFLGKIHHFFLYHIIYFMCNFCQRVHNSIKIKIMVISINQWFIPVNVGSVITRITLKHETKDLQTFLNKKSDSEE